MNGLFILLHDYYLAIRLVYDSYVRLRLKLTILILGHYEVGRDVFFELAGTPEFLLLAAFIVLTCKLLFHKS